MEKENPSSQINEKVSEETGCLLIGGGNGASDLWK